MPATKTKTKDARLSQHMSLNNGNQSWYYEAVWNFMGRKVRVDIRRNAYDFQSHRRVDIFDPAKLAWNHLCELPFDKTTHCLPVSYVSKDADIRLFEADEKDLLKEAALILG